MRDLPIKQLARPNSLKRGDAEARRRIGSEVDRRVLDRAIMAHSPTFSASPCLRVQGQVFIPVAPCQAKVRFGQDNHLPLATAGFALVQLFDRDWSIQDLISAFEIDIVATSQIALGIANQPVSSLQMKNASRSWNLGCFFHLNCIHHNRLDRPVNHNVSSPSWPQRPENIRLGAA